MRRLLVVLWMFLLVPLAHAQDTDVQIRLLVHEQWVDKSGFGLGAWQNVPDFTRPGSFRGLLVAGPAYKTKSFWIEIMGGGFLDAEGSFDPVFNVRSVAKFGRFSIFNEALYATEAKTLLLDPNLTFRLRGPLWIGVEADLLFKKGKDDLGFGPRVAIKFSPHATFALSYQAHSTSTNVLRSYLTITF